MKKPIARIVKTVDVVGDINKIARDYLKRGWAIVPIETGRKGPTIQEWEKLVIDENNVDLYFPKNSETNIGVILGPSSHGLADIDLDCDEAVALAPYFLPPTGGIFGRKGKPRSHYLYYVEDASEAKASIPVKDLNNSVVIEFRLGVGGRAAQTVFPGSIHLTGEYVEWADDGDIPVIPYADGVTLVHKITAAVILLRQWPSKGSRHEAALITGAFLARAGWQPDAIVTFIEAICKECGDTELEDRRTAALQSAQNTQSGDKQTYGLPKMQEFFGVEVANAVAKLVGYQEEDLNELLERMNEKFCIVPIGASVRILEFRTLATTEQQRKDKIAVFWPPHEYKTFYNHKKVKVGKNRVGVATWWLEQSERRQYAGVTFQPGDPAVVNGDLLNLWRGWGVQPKEGNWSLMRSHIRKTLANSAGASDDYIIKWTAWSLQNPGSPAQVALVFRGGKGVGKGVFARALMSAFGQHGLQISSVEQLVGRFNAHLLDCALLFADEAYWPGHKSAEGTLKRLITEPTLLVERKGVDAISSNNALHVIMATNEEWVVPAGHGERRYACFDCAEKVGDRGYFRALYREVEDGGVAAMMHDLIHMDLGDWHPRYDIPQTQALMAQKIMSLSELDKWWLDLLQRGTLPAYRVEDANWVSSRLLLDQARVMQPRLRHMGDLGITNFMRGCGAFAKTNGRTNVRGWVVPALSKARAAWNKKYGRMSWDTEAENWANEPDEAF